MQAAGINKILRISEVYAPDLRCHRTGGNPVVPSHGTDIISGHVIFWIFLACDNDEKTVFEFFNKKNR
jgi:hypothetical protein